MLHNLGRVVATAALAPDAVPKIRSRHRWVDACYVYKGLKTEMALLSKIVGFGTPSTTADTEDFDQYGYYLIRCQSSDMVIVFSTSVPATEANRKAFINENEAITFLQNLHSELSISYSPSNQWRAIAPPGPANPLQPEQ